MIERDAVSNIDQVRQASDIVEVVSSYVNLKRAGKDYRGLCPFHNEKTPSFYVVPDKMIYKCFGCGAGGDVFKFIQMHENVGFAESLAILANRAGITLDRPSRQSESSSGASTTELARVNDWACRWFQEQLAQPSAGQVREYASNRGITPESIKTFELGFAPDGWESLVTAAKSRQIPEQLLLSAGLIKRRDGGSCYDAFRNRLMFPIRDALNRVIGFGGRALGDDQAKYLNSPQTALFDKSRCLYGIHTARKAITDGHVAIVVEGYMDCIMAQQAGFLHTLATLGTSLTHDHARLLRRYSDTVILVFDSDPAGRQAADRSLGVLLAEKLDVRLSHVPKGKDPAEMLQEAGSAAFESVLTSAADALEYKWKQVRRRFRDAASGPDRRRAMEEYLSFIAGIIECGTIDPIQRGFILNQVGKLLGLGGEEVRRQLRIISRRTSPARRSAAIQAGPRSVNPMADDGSSSPPDAATAAMQYLMEVLLNAPEYYDAMASDFDPKWLLDEELEAIARAMIEMAEAQESFDLSRLIGRFESVETARRIVELQTAGQRRGNYAATVEGAIKRLTVLKSQVRLEEMMAELRRGREEARRTLGDAAKEDELPSQDDQDLARVQAISDAVRSANHFAAGKHRTVLRTPGARPQDSSVLS